MLTQVMERTPVTGGEHRGQSWGQRCLTSSLQSRRWHREHLRGCRRCETVRSISWTGWLGHHSEGPGGIGQQGSQKAKQEGNKPFPGEESPQAAAHTGKDTKVLLGTRLTVSSPCAPVAKPDSLGTWGRVGRGRAPAAPPSSPYA